MNRHILSGVLCIGVVAWAGAAWADPDPGPLPPVEVVYPSASSDLPRPPDAAGSELTERGRRIQGLYVPIRMLLSWKPQRIVDWVERTGANAVILDMKDDRGRVTFTRDLPTAQGPAHGMVKRMEQLVAALQAQGIYVIGRVVCFKDNQLPLVKPAAAIRDKRTGAVWRDRSGLAWVDPHSADARAHVVSVAKAAAALGLDEVQLDYVRFPVDGNTRWARFPNREGEPERYELIARLLADVDAAIQLPLSIDVFGLTAYNPSDSERLGQELEHLAPYIDAISPMLYLANWRRTVWENPRPSRTRALVHNAVRLIRKRLGDGIAIRPLLQAFPWRAKNFGHSFIAGQIDAAHSAGSSGHLFWNQSGGYRPVTQVWRSLPAISEQRSSEPSPD